MRHQLSHPILLGTLTILCVFGTVPSVVAPYEVPDTLCGSFGTYPNPLEITENDRLSFHPVVKFPMIWQDAPAGRIRIPRVPVADFSGGPDPNRPAPLAAEDNRERRRKELEDMGWFQRITLNYRNKRRYRQEEHYGIGRYDENRIAMYVSEMFQDTENQIDGYAGARTVHMGIDLGGPVGTKVFAFCDGTIHSAGYNPELGDYGHVVVVEHDLPSDKKVWALYGHLDSKSTKGKKEGQKVKKGQVIGRLGDIHENGGWTGPHVHFQLSTEPPDTHDMPGAVAVGDRSRALVQYPDPRWVLGPLY